MPDAARLRREYLSDICTALNEYVLEGGDVRIDSDAPDEETLTILLTLRRGRRFQHLLRETMGKRLTAE